MRPAAPITAVILAVLALAGCNANEKGRPVKLDKGTYMGLRDGEIDNRTQMALTQRIAAQAGGPVGVAVPQGDAKMPSGEAPAAGRITGQNY